MGQYHYLVNLDKREFVHPHKIGTGLKIWEQLSNPHGTGTAFVILACCPEARGGGDLGSEEEASGVVGRWHGDRIALIGDYAEREDLPKRFKADQIYNACIDGNQDPKLGYVDISDYVAAAIELFCEGRFVGEGWRVFVPNPQP